MNSDHPFGLVWCSCVVPVKAGLLSDCACSTEGMRWGLADLGVSVSIVRRGLCAVSGLQRWDPLRQSHCMVGAPQVTHGLLMSAKASSVLYRVPCIQTRLKDLMVLI